MDSYDILGVSSNASNKEIEVAYEDLKKKYDPFFNTSIHAYKKYREILRAYENIKDEKRREMYSLKDDDREVVLGKEEYLLYDYNEVKEEVKIDFSKVSEIGSVYYEDVIVERDLSYLYYLLNLKVSVCYEKIVKCEECKEFVKCPVCEGKKVVWYEERMVWCPKCHGKGEVSSHCLECDDKGVHLVKDMVSFYVDSDMKEFKGQGNEYFDGFKSNVRVSFNFYDKDNIKVEDDTIFIKYYLNKRETKEGVNKEFVSEDGAFKLEVSPFVENEYKKEIVFKGKKLVFVFYNDLYMGEDKKYYLFVNRDKEFVYFNDDYSLVSLKKDDEYFREVKLSNEVIIEDYGEVGKYGGKNGNLVVEVRYWKKDLQYVKDVKEIETSRVFNLLGGKVGSVYHFGFKGSNYLLKRDDGYYLLSGNSKFKRKLKDYFLFRVIGVLLWVLIPCLMLFIPYSFAFYISLISSLVVYFVIVNLLMEVEV